MALRFASCVTLGELLYLSGPVSHSENVENSALEDCLENDG